MSEHGFALWLKLQLDRCELSASELARRMGLSSSAVLRWTAGDSFPARRHLKRLARELGLPEPDVLQALGLHVEVGDLSEDERRLLEMSRQMSPSDASALREIARTLLQRSGAALPAEAEEAPDTEPESASQ